MELDLRVRIVYLLNSLGVGGAERLALALAQRMAERGHAVAMLVLLPPQPGDLPCAVPVVHLNMDRTLVRFAAAMAGGRRFLGEFRPNIVHSHGFHANLVARLVRLVAPAPAVLTTLHNVYEGGAARMFAYRMTDGLSRRTVAVSQAVAERFIDLGVVPRRKCSVVPNAIELDDYAPDAERRARTRADRGAGDEFVWLATGRNAPAKDYPTLLRAFERVRRVCPGARLWIACAAPDREPLRSLAQQAGDSVHWAGMRQDVAALLDAADGFVLSSAWEGMPLAVAEAMAMEKPVVATDVGGVRELVGGTGALVPSRNPMALADALLAVMRQSREARAALGGAARWRIVEGFTMAERAAQWEQLYRSLVEDR